MTAVQNAAFTKTNTVGYTGQPYVGVSKQGQFNTDADRVDADNQTAYGVYAGYNFTPTLVQKLNMWILQKKIEKS